MHGLTAIKVETEDCASCHGYDYLGGVSGISCGSCHPSYPHRSGWIAPSLHGLYTITASTTVTEVTSSCAQCHGDDFVGGDTGVSCYGCHPFPHPMPGWQDWIASHGLYPGVRDYSNSPCYSCHTTGMTMKTLRVSCTDCHSTYPHPGAQWTQRGSGAFHGDVVNSMRGPSVCGGCHGGDYLGRNTGVSCYSCHSLYPHSPDWGSSGHGGYVFTNGDGNCRGCHEDQRARFSLNPSSYPLCQFCH